MKREDRNELLRDLEHTRTMLLDGEQIFPLWEAIYAVIVSGLFVAILQTQAIIERVALSVIGIIFTLSWARLIARTYIYTLARINRMNRILKLLEKSVKIKKENIKLFNLTDEQRHTLKIYESWWNKKSTWKLRISLPKQMLAVWIIFVLYTIINEIVTIIFGNNFYNIFLLWLLTL